VDRKPLATCSGTCCEPRATYGFAVSELNGTSRL
jgi:hypothetical protein